MRKVEIGENAGAEEDTDEDAKRGDGRPNQGGSGHLLRAAAINPAAHPPATWFHTSSVSLVLAKAASVNAYVAPAAAGSRTRCGHGGKAGKSEGPYEGSVPYRRHQWSLPCA